MTLAETALLGAFAGLTIFIGLPLARMQVLGPRARVGLAMFAVGVLAFLFVDVFEHAFELVEEPVEELGEGEGNAAEAIGLFVLLAAGFIAGTAGLGAVERWMRPRDGDLPPIGGGSVDAATLEEAGQLEPRSGATPRHVLRLGMTIAVAIGLHNFAEGLAIGVSASSGEIAPRDRADHRLRAPQRHRGLRASSAHWVRVRPSWGWLVAAGVIAGAPVVPRLDHRLRGHFGSSGAGLLRPRWWRDPLRDRRGLERHAPDRPSRTRAVDARGRVPARRYATDLVVVVRRRLTESYFLNVSSNRLDGLDGP